MKRAAAMFSILMGLMMFGTWTFLFSTDQFPQVHTLPLETGYLLVAEFLTAAALVTGGYGILTNRQWAMPLILIALGELIYCTIRFAGELGQGGSTPGLGFFSAVAATSLIFAVGFVIRGSHQRSLR
jgi:hypothetical protein